MIQNVYVFVFTFWYLVAVLSMSGHHIGKNKKWILLNKFINHIDNTLDYKSQVELSIQMSYSDRYCVPKFIIQY